MRGRARQREGDNERMHALAVSVSASGFFCLVCAQRGLTDSSQGGLKCEGGGKDDQHVVSGPAFVIQLNCFFLSSLSSGAPGGRSSTQVRADSNAMAVEKMISMSFRDRRS